MDDECGFFFFLKDFIYLFLERGEGREKERERNINLGGASYALPAGDLGHNPGIFPDWALIRLHFGSQAGAQSSEAHLLGLGVVS